MTLTVISTDNAPQPVGPYNQAIKATGTLVFCSGQIALDPQTGDIVGANDVKQQTVQVMSNLAAVLAAAGASWEQVAKTTIFLANMDDFATVNAIYADYFDDAIAPARATVEVARLPKDVLIEIDCIAVIA